MLESRKGISAFWPRLLRINLPGVHVKQVGLLPPQDFPDANSEKRRRDQPKVCPSSPGQGEVPKVC
jgi:hypothetical protein